MLSGHHVAGPQIFYSDSQVVIATILWCRLVVSAAEQLIAFQTDCARRWFAQDYSPRAPGAQFWEASCRFGRIVGKQEVGSGDDWFFVQLPDCASLPANVEIEGLAVFPLIQYSFSFESDYAGRVKARQQIESFSRRGSAAGLHASRDCLYRTTRDARQP
jgi:hypothetical protein